MYLPLIHSLLVPLFVMTHFDNCKSVGARSQFHPRPHYNNPLQQHSPRTSASQSTGHELSSELVYLIALCGKCYLVSSMVKCLLCKMNPWAYSCDLSFRPRSLCQFATKGENFLLSSSKVECNLFNLHATRKWRMWPIFHWSDQKLLPQKIITPSTCNKNCRRVYENYSGCKFKLPQVQLAH